MREKGKKRFENKKIAKIKTKIKTGENAQELLDF